VTQNKKETAERCGVSVPTVYNVIEKMESKKSSEVVKKAAEEMAAEALTKTQMKADMVLDSISPTDVDSGRFPVRNKDGEITGYKYFGPSAAQKALTYGILTDKVKVIADYQRSMAQDVNDRRLMMPSDVRDLLSAVRGKIESISVLNVKVRDTEMVSDLVKNAERAMCAAEIAEEDHKVIDLDDLDNPNGLPES